MVIKCTDHQTWDALFHHGQNHSMDKHHGQNHGRKRGCIPYSQTQMWPSKNSSCLRCNLSLGTQRSVRDIETTRPFRCWLSYVCSNRNVHKWYHISYIIWATVRGMWLSPKMRDAGMPQVLAVQNGIMRSDFGGPMHAMGSPTFGQSHQSAPCFRHQQQLRDLFRASKRPRTSPERKEVVACVAATATNFVGSTCVKTREVFFCRMLVSHWISESRWLHDSLNDGMAKWGFLKS